MSKKLTYEYVKSKFEEEGYELLSTEYVNNHSKLLCKCYRGHEQYKTFQSILKKQGCRFCQGKKYNYEQVNEIFKSRGYSLTTKVYVDNKTPLEYKCKNGHTHRIRLYDFLAGKGCPYCADNYTKPIEYVRRKVEENNEVLLSTTFLNSRSFIKINCKKGHVYTITYNSYSQGHGCKQCQYDKLKKQLSLSKEEVELELENYGLILQSDYINTKTKIKYKCKFGHLETKTLEDLRRRKHKCTICYLLQNKGENHPNYISGCGVSDYCPTWTDKEYKEALVQRDNNICQNPYCYHTTGRLSIHHIDYDKKNCHPSNLITVCIGCNGRANTDRDWHKSWYQTIMSRKFGYKY